MFKAKHSLNICLVQLERDLATAKNTIETDHLQQLLPKTNSCCGNNAKAREITQFTNSYKRHMQMRFFFSHLNCNELEKNQRIMDGKLFTGEGCKTYFFASCYNPVKTHHVQLHFSFEWRFAGCGRSWGKAPGSSGWRCLALSIEGELAGPGSSQQLKLVMK